MRLGLDWIWPVNSQAARGQVLPFIALTLVALLGFAGAAVDVGYWDYAERQQQNATDAAALGGAQQLGHYSCPNSSVATTAADLDATANGFTDGGNVTVTVQNPPGSGPYAGNACAVDVQITKTNLPAFFTRLFGFGSTQNPVKISTDAVALVTGNNPGCLYLLDQSATANLNGDVMLAPGCAVYANSAHVETLASVITVKKFGYAHALDENLLTLFLGAHPQQMYPVADPCGEITSCAYLAGNPPAQSGCQSFVYTSVLPTYVYPGCYSDFENAVGIVTMKPGQYVFTGPVFNTGVLAGDGVTMYVTSSGGPVTLDGSVALTAPPTSGTNAGVLLYQVPGNSNTLHLNASVNLNLAGLVYAPSATAEMLGQANITFGKYMVFVLDNLKLLGNATLTLQGPSNGMSFVKNAVLVE